MVVSVPTVSAPLRTAASVVPLPIIGQSRYGSAPSQVVSRGTRTDPRPDVAAVSRGERPASVNVPDGLLSANAAPQRAQVLALRMRIKTRYKGQGAGARLAVEIP